MVADFQTTESILLYGYRVFSALQLLFESVLINISTKLSTEAFNFNELQFIHYFSWIVSLVLYLFYTSASVKDIASPCEYQEDLCVSPSVCLSHCSLYIYCNAKNYLRAGTYFLEPCSPDINIGFWTQA